MTDVLIDSDLDLEQELSRMTLRELQQLCKDPTYGLSAAGRTSELIARIVAFENGEPLDADALELKPGTAPAPVAPPVVAASVADPITGPATSSAPAETVKAPVKIKQKTGFFPATNTFRAEFPLGPRATLDDATHFQFIEETHNAAAAAGYRTKGAPLAGTRIGYSVIRTENGNMRSVIYETCAREVE
jgi:hypothetical protein